MPVTGTGQPVVFGEVLFDIFPDGSRVLGGAPFNVAWHLQAFGCAPLFVSRIGEDENGEQVRAATLVGSTALGPSTKLPIETGVCSPIRISPALRIMPRYWCGSLAWISRCSGA